MQELFDIITHKFRLINNKPTNLTNSQKDQLLDELLVEKKKESLRILVETRLQQSLDSKRITNPSQLIHILERTHQVMSIHDSQLPLPHKDEPVNSIVDLYIDFFTRQNCTLRAQEISNIHKKKLCPKGLLTTTLFNWLVEWVRKHFQEYLKTTIHSLYVDSRQPRHHKSHRKAQDQKSQMQLDTKYLLVKKHPPISVHRSIISSSFRQRRGMYSLELEERKAEKIEKVQKVRMKSQSPQYPSQYKLKFDEMQTIEAEENFPINRDIFYSAYAEEILSFYKNIQPCIPDLDLAFAKRLRKGGRRAELKKRVKQVAINLSKHMPIIKQSIDEYYQYYCNTHPIFKKKMKKARKMALEKVNKSDSPSKTSHGARSQSTQNIIDDRRKNIISSLSKKHRYVEIDQQSNKQSNLLPDTKVEKTHSKTNKQFKINNKSIQFTFPNQEIHRQSKFLVLNSGFISSQLQIIQQKAQKLKSKSRRPSKKSTHKQKHSKSIDLNQEQTIDFAYSSLPVTVDVTPSSHIRLPKLRRLK